MSLQILKYTSGLLQKLPAGFPGKARMGRFLLGLSSQPKDLSVTDKLGCKYIVPNFPNIIGFHLWIDGVYEPLTMKFLMKYLKRGSIFIDVGASIGVFTVPAAKLVGPKGLVLAIEASPTIFHYLQENIKLNGLLNVRSKNCGAGENNSVLPFYEDLEKNIGGGSFVPCFHNHPVSVHVQPLDQILSEEKVNHIDVIKVDVEGFEASVLRGAHRILTDERPPIILFESYNDIEAQEILVDYGYNIWHLGDFLHNKKPLRKILKTKFGIFVAKKY